MDCSRMQKGNMMNEDNILCVVCKELIDCHYELVKACKMALACEIGSERALEQVIARATRIYE